MTGGEEKIRATRTVMNNGEQEVNTYHGEALNHSTFNPHNNSLKYIYFHFLGEETEA